MHVGMGVIFQGQGEGRTDRNVYRNELRLSFLGLQPWGTPEQCYEKIVDTIERTGGESFSGVFSFGGMPYEIAEESLRLFASEVMPELERRMPREDQLLERARAGDTVSGEAFRLPPS